MREGEPLRIGREAVSFGRYILNLKESPYQLQHRLFVNDPWELIAEAIHRALPEGKTREIAHSFRRQAEDYFRAATIGRELAVRPVLLYYAFLNLSKAYAVAKGQIALTGKAFHGVTSSVKPTAIPGSLIRFDAPSPSKTVVFQELLKLCNGNPAVTSSDLRLGYLLPQILPGHRLWCYATNRPERFLTVERSDVLHLPATREIWLNLYINKNDLDRLGISDKKALSQSDLRGEFEIVPKTWHIDWIGFQQRKTTSYSLEPAQALAHIIEGTKNKIWETVRVGSPYRKPYIYCCPSAEQAARLPQILSIYLLMFFLGYVTRYSPGYFEYLLDSKYGPFIETFISESPMQFLYLMASEILGREVTKPAII